MKIALGVILTCVLCFTPTTFAQVHSVSFNGNYSLSAGGRFQVTMSRSYGGGISVRYSLSPDLYLSVSGGYHFSSLDQPNADVQWNWQIWDRRYRNWVNIYLSDTANYAGSVTSKQYVDTYPIDISIGTTITPMENLELAAEFGMGVVSYTRKLFHEERWVKKFPSIDHTFEYTYNNFAPNKEGNPIFLIGSLIGTMRISELVGIDCGVKYRLLIKGLDDLGIQTGDIMGSSNYPLSNEFFFTSGIRIFY